MSFIFFVGGMVIGFLMAVPIGAVGILCIRRTLNFGRRQGYITGLSGASADLLFATVSAIGIKLVSEFVTDHVHEIRVIGGVTLVLMALFLLRSRRPTKTNRGFVLKQTGIYVSTLAIALSNPLVMFSYGAVMSALVVAIRVDDRSSLPLLVLGVFFGSLLWFVTITSLADRFQAAMTEEKLKIVNRIAGVLLAIIGVGAILSGVQGMR